MRVLYVATDLRDADILQQEVKRAAPKLVLDVCPGVADARARAERSLGYDVMLLDASVSEADQLLLIQHVRTKQIPLPIALLVGQTTAPSSTLVSAADECITRGPRLAERLAPGLRMAIERYRIVATTLRENERLKRSEARLRLIIEALPAGVVLVDQAGRILAMNVAGASLVGTSGPSDVVGRELYSLADADGAHRLRELVTRALAGERGHTEFECHGPDGTQRPITIEALCIQRDETQAQGSVLGVLSATAPAPPAAEAGVEFSFGGDLAAMADERAALDQALETMRLDVERLEQEGASERGRVQQLLAELERARATAAEHHAHRAALDEQSRVTSARIDELEARNRDDQAAMEAVANRAGSLNDEAVGLRHERQRLAHESDALKQELLEQRRARLELEERMAASDVERERLTAVLATAQAAAETRIGQLDEELRSVKGSIGVMTTRERALAAELDATRFEASRLRDDLGRESEQRARFESELDHARTELRAALGGHEAAQASTAAELAELQAQLQASRGVEQALRAELDAAGQREQAVRAELEGAGQREQAILAEIEAARQLEGSLRREIEGAAGARQEVEQRLTDAAARAADLDAQLGQALQREQQLQQDASAAASVRAELEQQLATAGARVHELETAAHETNGQIEAISGELAASRFEATQLRDELARESERRTRVEADLEARSFDLTSTRASADADRDVFQGRIAELESEASAARAREDAAGNKLARLHELEAAVADMEARRQAAVARVAELEERRRNEQTALSAAAQRQNELAQELAAVRDEAARAGGERQAIAEELGRERERRQAIEDELTVRTAEVARGRADGEAQVAARDAEIATLRAGAEAQAAALREAADTATRIESEGRAHAARLEAAIEQGRTALEAAADREAALAAELQSLQQERDTRGRQAFELESVVAREREDRTAAQTRLETLEREAADAGAQAEARLAQMQRDHQEVVARLQKLLEQAAAREFQAAALATPRPGDRVRRRPAEKIGQLAAAMANDLNATIADVAEDARRLLGELPDGTTSRARAEQTLQTATRAGQLVRHLLRLSERESRMIPRVEVSGLVRSNEALLRQLAGADIDLRFELAAGLANVECDAEEVVQVLSTFVVTVRGALPLGGVIRISTQERGRPDGRRRGDSALMLTVTAEGYGMAPVPTAGCEEVVTRIGGTFSTTADPNQSMTALHAVLPTEARNPDTAAPGWSQTA